MGQHHFDTHQLLIGESTAIRELRMEIVRVARGKQSVLIQGATGTGKELVAQALHIASRRPGRFVDVNIAAISETLFESELFGHLRGAFSGAMHDRAGLFRSAEHGTLFLDEIGELSIGMQAKLLRVLEQREVWPVGADTGRPVDLRVITATNANLRVLVEQKQFRSDLLYHLRGTVLSLPLLSDRVDDIPLLTDHFLRLIAVEYSEPVLRIAHSALDVLCAHPWPGNVRELRQVLEYAVIRADEPVLRDVHVTRALDCDGIGTSTSILADSQHRLLEALATHHGDARAAARSLGMSRATLYRHMRKFGISLRKRPTAAVSDARTCP